MTRRFLSSLDAPNGLLYTLQTDGMLDKSIVVPQFARRKINEGSRYEQASAIDN